ncbi:hypothetical protein [Aminobacter sp. MSH1]|uniref:hypothetical protein n=1 Tax=Aminobacter sp. MSH1 TaxID=374606 RepID=UPI000D3400DB|nr:hypothetical protein [Aminobacter sp. MSH1]
MSDVTFNFRVDEDLKKAFVSTSTSLGWNASLLLRNYMRQVVDSGGRNVPTSPLTEGEQLRRQEAVTYGEASVMLEGLTVPQDAKELARQFVSGELELGDYAAARHGGGHDR